MLIHLSENPRKVLEVRYLQRDVGCQIMETPEELFQHVARSIAKAEERFDHSKAASKWEEDSLEALIRLDFLPNSPTLMNAGTALGQLSACFVLPVEDNLSEIFESLRPAALIQQSGGGTAFAFSRLRPKGKLLASTPFRKPSTYLRRRRPKTSPQSIAGHGNGGSRALRCFAMVASGNRFSSLEKGNPARNANTSLSVIQTPAKSTGLHCHR